MRLVVWPFHSRSNKPCPCRIILPGPAKNRRGVGLESRGHAVRYGDAHGRAGLAAKVCLIWVWWRRAKRGTIGDVASFITSRGRRASTSYSLARAVERGDMGALTRAMNKGKVRVSPKGE